MSNKNLYTKFSQVLHHIIFSGKIIRITLVLQDCNTHYPHTHKNSIDCTKHFLLFISHSIALVFNIIHTMVINLLTSQFMTIGLGMI